jgi:hypothetical protein
MLKVHILSICSQCNGDAYVPVGEAEDFRVTNSLVTSHAR